MALYPRVSASTTIPTEVYYRYDAFGRRVGHYYKWNGTPSLAADSEFHSKELVYDGVMLVEEWYADSAPASLKNKLKRRYYYEEGINKLALVENYNGQELPQTSYVPVTDDRGTLMGVVDAATGQLVEKPYYNSTGLCKAYHYDPGTGTFVESLWPDTTYNIGRSQYIPFGWCGMYRDPFTGKYHTHYRDYDPVHGRWLSEDPAGYADGLNLYAAYMGVNGVDPLGLENNRDDVLNAYNKLFGNNNPLVKAFLNSGHQINTGDVLGDLALNWQFKNGWIDALHYNVRNEEDIDLASAALYMQQGMKTVLGKSYAMQKEYLKERALDEGTLEWGMALKELQQNTLKANASDIAAMAETYYSSLGIFNEAADTVMTMGEVLDGNYYAMAGFLPIVTSSGTKLLRVDKLDPAKIKLTTSDGRRIMRYVDDNLELASKYHKGVNDHHLFFKSLGGSNEAANLLSMQMLIHNGNGIGLHQHLMGHMSKIYNKGKPLTYKKLTEIWKGMNDPRIKNMFRDNMLEGYSSYFKGSSDYNEIMDLVRSGIDTNR